MHVMRVMKSPIGIAVKSAVKSKTAVRHLCSHTYNWFSIVSIGTTFKYCGNVFPKFDLFATKF